MNTLPSVVQVSAFLTEFFRTDSTPRYLGDYNDIVADHFQLSHELRNLKKLSPGTNPHSEDDFTELGSRVGRTISQNLKEAGIVKLVIRENWYEGANGPDAELTNSAGQRAAKTRAGLSFIYPSIRILRDGCGKSLNEIEDILISTNKFNPDLVRQAVKDLANEPLKTY